MKKCIDSVHIERLAQIIREVTGNQVQEKNFSMIESRICSHMLRLKFDNIETYWNYFEANEVQERQVLQSLMTTHHTFFFRERAHFEVIEKWIDQESDNLKARYNKAKQPLKVWSAACSRGQEVYSLALFLEFNLFKKYGVPFQVVGTDIDAESVAYAKNGVYPIKEVNAIPKFYLNGYWKKGTGEIKDFAAVHPNLKSKVKFEVLNILEVDQKPIIEKYDIIFCRNLFIYFSEENIQKTSIALANRVSERGLFVSGISEPIRFSGWNYESIGPSCYVISSDPSASKSVSQRLPVQRSPGKELDAVVSLSRPQLHGEYSVLCVDDSRTIQMMMKKIFSEDPNCKHIEFAMNGREAREKLDKQKFDLVTLDIHMPEVSGIAFLEKLYNVKKDPPVLMVSSVDRTDIALASKSLLLGAFDYVEKPEMNNLRKSIDEILMKAKMALRHKADSTENTESSFDKSIAQKIVVPDASQCLRIVIGSTTKLKQLEQIIKGQEDEYRSPATFIIWKDSDELVQLQNKILDWSAKKINIVQEKPTVLKPNQFYLFKAESADGNLDSLHFKSISMQVLDHSVCKWNAFKTNNLQILFDETLSRDVADFERKHKIRIHDVTPSTSFPSLSVEFFANVRKLAA